MQVLYKNGKHEVRIYPPCRRTISVGYGVERGYPGTPVEGGMLNMQFPHLVFAYRPAGRQHYNKGGFLFACFALEDLSQLSEQDRNSAIIYAPPFPQHFDHGKFGPCCLDGGSPYYYQGDSLDFQAVIQKFWMRRFAYISDFGQGVTSQKWREMSLEELQKMLKKAAPMYRAKYSEFLEAADIFGKNPDGVA